MFKTQNFTELITEQLVIQRITQYIAVVETNPNCRYFRLLAFGLFDILGGCLSVAKKCYSPTQSLTHGKTY